MSDNSKDSEATGQSRKTVKNPVAPPGWRRLVDPGRWSLKERFVYFSGVLLLVGGFVLIAFFGLALNIGTANDIEKRLSSYEQWVNRELRQAGDALLNNLAHVASRDNVVRAMSSQDAEKLREAMGPYIDRLRLHTGVNMRPMRFHLPEGQLLYNTWEMRTDEVENEQAHKLLLAAQVENRGRQGVVLTPEGPRIEAAVPIVDGRQALGSVSASLSFSEIFASLDLPRDYGLALVLNPESAAVLGPNVKFENIGGYALFGAQGNIVREDIDFNDISTGKPVAHGLTRLLSIPLKDFMGQRVGCALLSIDVSEPLRLRNVRILQFSTLVVFGVALLWVMLYYNVKRIRDFLYRLKKIIIASHSNEFSERFEGNAVHCLDVLHCGNKRCPVYRDPALVCYLETGSEAISPRWRNTCVFLNKYGNCSNCPVYLMRHGDEIMEMRHVVNTMMRLWGRFLNHIGMLLTEVLRTGCTTMNQPSLDQVSEYLEEMARMTKFGHDLQGVYDQEEVFTQLDYIFTNHFGFRNFTILLVNNSDNRMDLVLDHGVKGHQEVMLNAELCRAKRGAEEVQSAGNPVLCPHFCVDPEKQVRCCIPMVMGGRVGAVFSMVAEREEWDIISHKLPLIRKYLDETAPVLSSLRLLQLTKDQALRDPLTKCHNRRFLDEYLSQYEYLTQRDGRTVGFLMADLDHFKMVNDEHGHQAGDMILKQIVEIIRNSIRRSDLLIRYGGEEFLILLLEIEPNGSEPVAEKIRNAVEAASLSIPSGDKIKKTISIGVAEFPSDVDVLYKAIKFADVALYAAKNGGRNRVLRFKPEMWTDVEY